MLVFAITVMLARAQSAPLPKLVGTLSVAKGNIQLERAGREPQLAGKYVRLRVGDKVIALDKPVAWLMLDMDHQMYRLPDKGSWLVGDRSLKLLEGASPLLVRRGSPLRAAPGGLPPTAMAGIIRGGGIAVLPTGAVLDAPIRLTWTRASGSSGATVELMDDSGKKVWSKSDAASNEVVLPFDKTSAGAWMQARVIQSGGGNVTSASTWVRLLPPDDKQALVKAERELRVQLADSPPALGLALGDLWATAGLVSALPKALDMVYPEYSAQPRSPETERARHWKHGEWLEAAGFPGDARDEYEEAWQSGERSPDLKEAIERLGGKAEPSDLEMAIGERDRLTKLRNYKEALPWAQKVVNILRTEEPDSLALSRGMTELGLDSYFLSDRVDAEKAWIGSLAILEKLAPGSLELAANLNKLGIVAKDRGDMDLAQRRHEAALAIRKKLVPGSLDVAASELSLGLVSLARGNLEVAQGRFEAALTIREKLVPGSLDVAWCLNNLGIIAFERGELGLAQSRLEAALAIREKFTPGSLDMAANLLNLGGVANNRGDLELADRRYQAAIAIYEKLSPGSLDVANCLNNLGLVAMERGDLVQAQHRFEAALAIRGSLAPGSLDFAASLSSLGDVASQRGELDRAQRLLDDALAINEKLAPGSLQVALSLMSLGGVALDRGDLDVAQHQYEAALAIREKLAPGSRDVMACLNNLGIIAEDRGDLHLAERRYEAALAISEKLAPGSLDVAACENNLAVIAKQHGDLDLAERESRTALEIDEKLAPGSLDLASTLKNLGVFADQRGDLDLAQNRYESALAIYETLAPASLDVALSLRALATIAASRGDRAALEENELRRLASAASLLESEGLSTPNDLGALGTETSKTLRDLGLLEDPQSLYGWLPTLRGAGLTLQVRSKTAERAASADEAMRSEASDVEIATKQETDWASNPRPKDVDQKTWEGRLLDLRAKRQSAQLKLSTLLREKDPRLGTDLRVSQEDVQKAIPMGAALVEILKVGTWDRGARKAGPDAYSAFIVRHDAAARFVRLGDAKGIDDLVEAWQTQMAVADDPGATETTLRETQGELRSIGRKLYDKLIKPLGGLPANLMVAPDSDLNALPFGTLVDGRGRYLVETTLVSVVGSGRDLVEKPAAGEPGPAAVIAAPDFGADSDMVAKTNGSLKTDVFAMRAPNAKGSWAPLPSAENEGRSVAKALGVEPITGIQATKTRLYSLVRPRVLHIATHGFFFPPIVESKERESMMTSEMSGRSLRAADSPMLRSGLILAGANTADKPDPNRLDDGWATALEISQMDLRGTELVVLSACDTARGDARGAEGVFGLQRALRFAGAHTLVMSLFKVPDEATRSLMEHFYGAWKPGDPPGTKLSALRNAQLAMIRDPKTRHPRNWAGFVLMGER